MQVQHPDLRNVIDNYMLNTVRIRWGGCEEYVIVDDFIFAEVKRKGDLFLETVDVGRESPVLGVAGI